MEDKKTILMIANSDTGANGFLSFVERLKDRNDIRFVMVCHPRVQIRTVKEKSRNLGNASFKVLDFDKRERQRGKALLTAITNMSRTGFMFQRIRRLLIPLRLSRRTGRDFAGQKS